MTASSVTMQLLSSGSYADVFRAPGPWLLKVFHEAAIAREREYWRAIGSVLGRLRLGAAVPAVTPVPETELAGLIPAPREDAVCLRMTRLPGSTLEQDRLALLPHELKAVVGQLDVLLQQVHAHGYAHGDLSPSNVLAQRTPTGIRVGLIDWDGLRGPGIPRPPVQLESGTPGFSASHMNTRANDDYGLRQLGRILLKGRK